MADAFETLASAVGAPVKRVGFEVRVPQLVPPGANVREHHMARHRRVKKARADVAFILSRHEPPPLPVVVTITRCAPRLLRDDDNLVFSAKATRDEISAWLGVDDSDKRVTWKVAQEKATKRGQGTVIRIERRA